MRWMLHTLQVFVLLACSALACRPVFRIWESRGYGEDYVEHAVEYVTITDEPDTAAHGIEGGSRSHQCYVGMWIGYQYDRYQGSTTVYYEKKGIPDNLCGFSSIAYTKSLKVIGDPNDYTKSAVVTWMNRWNEWADTTYLNDTAEMINPLFNSMILMGNVEVELFTEANFQGESFCIGPNNGNYWYKREYDERNHLRNGTEIFTNLTEMEVLLGINEFHSFTFGCSGESHKN